MYHTSDIRKGLKVEIDNAPWTVTDFLFVKPGKGCAFTRTKLKNLITGATLDRTYKTGENLAEADVEEARMQFLYNDGEAFHFMNLEDYDQLEIPEKVLGKDAGFLVEQMEVDVLLYKGLPCSIILPNFVEIEITYCEPGVKGNTAQGGNKPATLASGATINVPLFVENGTVVRVDTRTREYVGRA